jgi:hypothetical protein
MHNRAGPQKGYTTRLFALFLHWISIRQAHTVITVSTEPAASIPTKCPPLARHHGHSSDPVAIIQPWDLPNDLAVHVPQRADVLSNQSTQSICMVLQWHLDAHRTLQELSPSTDKQEITGQSHPLYLPSFNVRHARTARPSGVPRNRCLHANEYDRNTSLPQQIAFSNRMMLFDIPCSGRSGPNA